MLLLLEALLATAVGGLLVDPKRPACRTGEPAAVDSGLGSESNDDAAN